MDTLYKRILWFGMAAVLVFSPIARGAVRIWSITPVLLIEFSLVFVWLWRANNYRGQSLFKRTALDIPILIFAIIAFISFVFSIYKHDSFYALLKLIGYIGIYYLVVNEFDHMMRKRLVWVAISIGTGLSVYGILQYIGVFGHSWWAPKEFLASTYVNHNHFSGYLELAIPAAVAILFKDTARKPISKLVLTISLVIMTAALILAQSRGAWLSFAVSILLMISLFARKGIFNKKSLYISFTILAAILSFLYFGRDLVIQRIGTIANIAQGEPTPEARLKIWQGGIAMIKDNFFIGTGIGTFIWGFPRYRPEGLNVMANFAHNEYLNMAGEMGMLAPFIMIWMIALILKKGLKESLNTVKIGCATGVLSLALHGLVDFNFHIPSNMILSVVYASLIMSDSKMKREEDDA